MTLMICPYGHIGNYANPTTLGGVRCCDNVRPATKEEVDKNSIFVLKNNWLKSKRDIGESVFLAEYQNEPYKETQMTIEELEEYRRKKGLCLACGGQTTVDRTKVTCTKCRAIYELQDYTGER